MANLIGYGAAQVFPEQDTGAAIRDFMKAKATGKATGNKDQDSYGEAPFEIDDIKQWEDQRNFGEIMKNESTLREVWNKSYQSGHNIRNPQTPQDNFLSKQFYDAWKKHEGDVDLYNTQGERVADVIKQIDKLKPEEYDPEATQKNLEAYIDESSMSKRAKMLDNIIVRKGEEFDGLKYVTDTLSNMTSMSKYITDESIDPKTGKMRKETWQGIPLTERKEAITQMYNAGPEQFRSYVDKLRKDNKDKTLDNSEWDNAEFAANYFSNIKEGGKKDAVYYSTGGGDFNLGIGYGAGKPKLEDGQYVSNEDSVWLHNKNNGEITQHTSPFQVNLNNDQLFGKKTSHMQMPVSAHVINSESGEQEVIGSQALFRPNKIEWMPVVSKPEKKPGIWNVIAGPVFNVSVPLLEKYPEGSVLDDAARKEFEAEMERNPGSSAGYTWRPYVVGQMGYERKEGQVGGDDRILNLNRSVFVPYEDVADEFKGKFGPQWNKAIGNDVAEITKQANFGSASTQEKQEVDFNSLGL